MERPRDFQIEKLSQHQLDVLALVAEHKSSKEIARELGISPDTVDQRLKRVKAITGVSGRAEAARLYRQTMQYGGDYQGEGSGNLVYQTSDLASRCRLSDEPASLGNEGRTSDEGRSLHQPNAAYSVGFVGWQSGRSWYAELLEASRKNDLTPLARTLCIGVTAFFFLLSAAAAIVLGEALSRFF
jgi:DNA-binding CsgD family transcriptional regulator